MEFRRSNFDVTNTVDVTSPDAVGHALEDIYLALYQDADPAILRRAIRDIAALFHGEHPDYAACDTGYHDLQHTLDVTLAAARLMDGYERAQDEGVPLGSELFIFGILTALFHDSGYLRRRGSEDDRRGAEFTLTHVARGEVLFRQYLQQIGLIKLAETAAQIVHFTGYEIPVDRIPASTPAHRVVGCLVATADMLAQLSDRCYLEKCHDRLFQEFALGGIARKRDQDGNEQVVYASPRDLVLKTPAFYQSAKKRMEEVLDGVYRYAEKHFGGQNPYLEIIERNIRFAEYIAANNADIGLLQRSPPNSPGSEHPSAEAMEREYYVEDRRKRMGDRRRNISAADSSFSDRRNNKGDRRKST